MSTALRVTITLLGLMLFSLTNFLLAPVALLGSGKIAGQQLLPSDSAYLAATYEQGLLGQLHLPLIFLVGFIALMWWGPVYRLVKNSDSSKSTGLAVLLALGVAASAMQPSPAGAYYSKSNYAEPYFILPNETAFWVPDVGDNKDSQVQYKSKEYYDAKKVSTKRFDIPHAVLPSSGASFLTDYYVPTGRLIVVDLAPYSREWVKSSTRGTAAKDESFPCQSSEGINITLEVSIGVSLSEENASTYLAHFGVEPIGDRNDPNILFTSVLHARRLTSVMDTVGRNKVQALMCNEMTTRTFDEANHDAIKAMQSAKDKSEAYLKSVGITLDYLGWAGTMEFDKDIQQAVNDRYTAEKLRPVLDVMRQQAAMDAARKWNGQLPASLSGLWMLPADFWATISGWFTPKAAATTGGAK